MSEQPTFEKVRAIDVKPYRWAIWCTVGGGPPFANHIESRMWSEDGKHIWFMLGTHNFHKAEPDEILELVRVDPGMSPALLLEEDMREAGFLAKRPKPAPGTAAAERAAVVAFLRKKSNEDCADGYWYDRYELAADAIEAGEHVEKAVPGTTTIVLRGFPSSDPVPYGPGDTRFSPTGEFLGEQVERKPKGAT